ncbi:DeoR/GlpR family DNA-binding transcription regulator [Stenotrophomonas maltophilia]|uniref:DeoR/GlpR family DNA-binding transcription regulator n=1 Tax=Stenotrophomonas maltophilia TaxID=40324 RepID=UPI0002B8BB1B|nr:DeoR/GlpR family DNA-binding transcription regulator [Stenotrophomonas maltophilia]EMF59320.1 transcriptional regulator, DeoR family [Stenotrophomonas maltophilia EPM1]KWV54553.1 DeoR family transcriptional regulator [Stenotrophomonas maltophilia]MBA0462162.1 DeoR/GlpR transcriptional regulator [Stenotrophomonas maltophilia]MBC8774015.1 DeoR/GlpR transcriptional regulator [Stenotrophomonas maltophilia]MBH1610654.1 DeoR/GlpR transcriptional regulator [Stenotrophomonas maltophilia]
MSADPSPLPAQRTRQILEVLRQQGRVVAAELARRYAVSEDSIRRDLRELAAQGLCQRVYGGAVLPPPKERPLRERLTRDRGDKAELAARVCALLQPGQVVLLDAGSTNLAIAQQLPAALGLTVITNAPQIAVAASLHEGTSVQLIGGRLASGGGAVGAEALAQVQRLRADVYLPGPCAVDGDTGVWAMDAEEATLKRAMVACSSRIIVAATTEKLGARGHWQIASLDEIDDLVLTTSAPPALAARFHAAGIAVHPTPP